MRFGGKIPTREVCAIIILNGQGGVGAPIPVMFQGRGGGTLTEASTCTVSIPNTANFTPGTGTIEIGKLLYSGWGNVTIFSFCPALSVKADYID